MPAYKWNSPGLRGAGVLAALLLAAGVGYAQDSELAEIRARLEKLEQKNAALRKILAEKQLLVSADTPLTGTTPQDVKKLVADALQEEKAKQQQADAVKAALAAQEKKDAASHWYQVGTNLQVSAYFDQGGSLWLTTPNKDFTLHLGALVQYDNVFWTQSPGLRAAPGAHPAASATGPAYGLAAGGIGDLEDGTYFRRIRPLIEGTLWETGEYRFNFDLANDQYNTLGLNEFYMGLHDVPFFGTIRVGHMRTPMGLEADMSGPSRVGTFMERSSYAEAIELNQQLMSGLWASNNYFDEHATVTASIFRNDNAATSGVVFGDGQYGAQGRLTLLPIYDCDGRQFLHLGISGGWRNGTSNLAASPDRTFELRSRPELRDDDSAASPSGGQLVPNADSNRMIDTGSIVAQNDFLTGLEFLYVRGPFSLQAEYGWNYLQNVIGFAPVGTTLTNPLASPQNYVFAGGYVQVAYTLTGEARAYDRQFGTLASPYFGKSGPFNHAWLVRDENGHLNWGLGAWEVAARFGHVDLNDGSGVNRIQGGIMDSLSLALNWYLNSNVNILFDWVYDHRYDLPPGSIPGFTSGFGTRLQFQF